MPDQAGSPARQLHRVAATGPDATARLLPLLARALSGEGPALLPVPGEDAAPPDTGHPDTGAEVLAAGEDDAADPTALVVATSGSTGAPKEVLLPASALLASASATHDRLGGPGRWLLALPLTHVAGLLVLVRSLVTRRDPIALPPGRFDPVAFAETVAAMPGPRRYTALVPTQVARLLDAGPEATSALAALDAVLVGGAATPPTLQERAGEAGVRLVLTYGMTETCGGCVYDGRPLDGVGVDLAADGRITVSGATVARGYRGATSAPAADAAGFHTIAGGRAYRTADLGRWDGDRLDVLGRADDVLVTGGLQVAPARVERALLRVPGVAEAVVVGAPDADWGQRVVAAIVPAGGAAAPTLADLRARLRSDLATHELPRQVLVLSALPAIGPGKPDRGALAALAAASPYSGDAPALPA